MKKLTGAFNNDKKKKSSTLTNDKTDETTPRKINEEDYEVIRLYAFQNRLTILEATEKLHDEIKKVYSRQKGDLINIDPEEYKSPNQKSIRISVEFNEFLKELSMESRIPSKFIFSFFVKLLK